MQLDLNGNSLDKMDSALFLAHALRHHRTKLYKTCQASGCNEFITNKSWQHYCIDHMIKTAAATGVVIPHAYPLATSPGTLCDQ